MHFDGTFTQVHNLPQLLINTLVTRPNMELTSNRFLSNTKPSDVLRPYGWTWPRERRWLKALTDLSF